MSQPNKPKLNAYYYSFEETGIPEIDLILSAVARAGKEFHSTDDWNKKLSDGSTVIEGIQKAANDAAKAFAAKDVPLFGSVTADTVIHLDSLTTDAFRM